MGTVSTENPLNSITVLKVQMHQRIKLCVLGPDGVLPGPRGASREHQNREDVWPRWEEADSSLDLEIQIVK